MSQPTPNAGPIETPPASSKATWILFALLLLLPLGFVLQAVLYAKYGGSSALQSAIDETNELDPGWGWDDLEAKRVKVPDPDNSALVIDTIAASIRADWPDAAVQRLWTPLDPLRTLTPEEAELLRSQLRLIEPAIKAGRQLSKMPLGYWSGKVLDNAPEFISVTNALLNDTLMRLEEGDSDGSLESARAVLFATRSYGDSPVEAAQLLRMQVRGYLFLAVKRLLANCHPSAAALAEFQRLLEEEAQQSLFLIVVRGERAGWDNRMKGTERSGLLLSCDVVTGIRQIDAVISAYRHGTPTSERAAVLRYCNRIVEIAKRPSHEQEDELRMFETGTPMPRPLGGNPAPYWQRLGPYLQDQAELNCLIAALAVERFRLKDNQWPNKLDDLVPHFLAKVPHDPYRDHKLLYKRTADGVTVYSVGANAADDGGQVRVADGTKGIPPDFGVELRDVAKRRTTTKSP